MLRDRKKFKCNFLAIFFRILAAVCLSILRLLQSIQATNEVGSRLGGQTLTETPDLGWIDT